MNVIGIPSDFCILYKIWINKSILEISLSILLKKLRVFINDSDRLNNVYVSNMIKPY